MSFPSVLKRIIGKNVFGELYASLLGLGIMINVNFLKYEGQ